MMVMMIVALVGIISDGDDMALVGIISDGDDDNGIGGNHF